MLLIEYPSCDCLLAYAVFFLDFDPGHVFSGGEYFLSFGKSITAAVF